MASTTTIHVNFGRPMPVFPLHSAVLVPHSIAPLNIFEPRYRQMVSDALDGHGLIVMAVFEGDQWKQQYHGRPPLRPAVCVGHIAEHHKYSDGRYAVILQGVCRGRIIEELPATEGRLYREAMIEPVGFHEADESSLEPLRDSLSGSLAAAPLCDLRVAKEAVKFLKDPEVPTSVVIEFLGVNLPDDADKGESRYQWLAASELTARAAIVHERLGGLERLLKRAAKQRSVETPKGCNWN